MKFVPRIILQKSRLIFRPPLYKVHCFKFGAFLTLCWFTSNFSGNFTIFFKKKWWVKIREFFVYLHLNSEIPLNFKTFFILPDREVELCLWQYSNKPMQPESKWLLPGSGKSLKVMIKSQCQHRLCVVAYCVTEVSTMLRWLILGVHLPEMNKGF